MPNETPDLRYDDWTIAKRHRDIVADILPAGVREPQLYRQIPGVVKGRFNKDFKAGVYLMPLTSTIRMTFSDRLDVARSTLLVVGEATTTRQANSTPLTMAVMEVIRTKFANRRVMDMKGELYSNHTDPDYDVDDDIARKMDLLVIRLNSYFREDR